MRVMQKETKILLHRFTDLFATYQRILKAAISVQDNAQAPYSQFKVGAAVLDANHGVTLGVNVERCTYTQTTHAEQNAIDSMVAKYGPIPILVVAVCAIDATKNISKGLDEVIFTDIPFPCGHCLQIIWENCLNPQVPILTMVSADIVAEATLADLLPVRFGHDNLGIKPFNGYR